MYLKIDCRCCMFHLYASSCRINNHYHRRNTLWIINDLCSIIVFFNTTINFSFCCGYVAVFLRIIDQPANMVEDFLSRRKPTMISQVSR